MRTLGTTTARIERFLHRRGFAHPDVRRLVAYQVFLAGASSIVALAATGFSVWGLSFAAGALLITINFWALAKVAQQLVYVQKGAVTALLLVFYFRLILTGLALFALIVWLRSPMTALLAGVSTVAVSGLWFGLSRVREKSKEA